MAGSITLSATGLWLLLLPLTTCFLHNVERFSIPDAAKDASGSDKSASGLKVENVTLNLQKALNMVGPRFVGVTIDSSKVRENWNTLDFSSPKVEAMARALAPSYFRLGGTNADCMTFEPDQTANEDAGRQEATYTPNLSNFNMSVKQWLDVTSFSERVGWDFIMDLNARTRNPDGSWDPSNALKLLQFSADRNISIAGFELGNEYDLYNHTFNYTLTPEQLAQDVAALQGILGRFKPYFSSFIVGPETGGTTTPYFQKFLSAGGSSHIRASSFHHYYFKGETAHVSQFTDVRIMDELKVALARGLGQSRAVDPLLPVWLSETSSAYSGGAPNISDRFAAGFLWLDKLGVCAEMGVSSVIRQDFYGIHYGLMDIRLNPTPDFWLTVLYKRLVLGAVFSVSGPRDIRVYAACANQTTFGSGSVTVYYLNPNNYTVYADLPQFPAQRRLLYSLTPGDGDGLVSQFSKLNGEKLELRGEELPPLSPVMLIPGPIFLPQFSFGFIVLMDAHVELCREY